MKASGDDGLDFDLNLAPIIDCFTVLITYLLVSASFITLGLLDVTVAASAPSASSAPPPSMSLNLRLRQGGLIEVQTEGSERNSIRIPALGGQWDIAALSEQLKQIKERNPALETGLIGADEGIRYGELVRVVEASKVVLPNVALSAEELAGS
jgi:biopolymer transport protein ExbD